MTAYTLTSGVDSFTLNPADTISGLLANLQSTDTINGSGQTLTFTNLNTFFNLTTAQFAGVHNIGGIKVSNGATTALIHVNDAMAAQAGANFTVDGSADTGATVYDVGAYVGAPVGSALTGAHHVTIVSGTGANILQTDAASLSHITYTGVGASNQLQLTSGGLANVNVNLNGGTVTGINGISIVDSAAYTLTLADVATRVTLNGNRDDVVYGSVNAASQYILNAAGQTAIGGAGSDIFTTTAADFSPTYTTTINGGGGFNTLQLTGGGTYSLAQANISNIQRIAVSGASKVSFNNFPVNFFSAYNSLSVTLDSNPLSNDQIDLRSNWFRPFNDPVLNVNGGNGNNIVWLGSFNGFFFNNGVEQTVSLGTGQNTVLEGFNIQNKINGGTGTVTTNTVGNNSGNTLVYTTQSTFGPGPIVEANTVVGFHAIDLGFNDSNLSFFGKSFVSPTVLVDVFFNAGANFTANNAAGQVVYGTINGGDVITLNASDQSYIAGGDAFAQAQLGNSSSGNTVLLNAGSLTAATNGTQLIGNAGLGAPTSELVIGAVAADSGANIGTFNFGGAGISVHGFSTVDVQAGANVNLTLDNNGGVLPGGGYTVIVDGGTVTDNLLGGLGDDAFVFDGSGTFTGSLNGGLGTNSAEITDDAVVDLTHTSISQISKITVDAGSTLILTSDQLVAANFIVDPGTLVINMGSAVGPTVNSLNIADLTNLVGFDTSGTIVVNANNLGDTIDAGPGTEIINLGTGNDWVNAGSGNDTINASAASGQSAVIIVGDSSVNDLVNLGTANVSRITFDTILGAASPPNGTGSTTVNIVGGALPPGFPVLTLPLPLLPVIPLPNPLPVSNPTTIDFSQQGGGLTASLYNINGLVIGGTTASVPGSASPGDPNSGNAEAIFTIEQLTALGGQEKAGFTIAPDAPGDLTSVLKIIADIGPPTLALPFPNNVVSDANLYGFSGTVDIVVTKNGTGPGPLATPIPLDPVTTTVSGITSSQNVIVDQSAITGWNNVEANGYAGNLTVYAGGPGSVEKFDAGQGSNRIVFNQAGAYADSFTGNGDLTHGRYIFEINADTDLTGSTFHGVSQSVSAVIKAGVTGTVNASDVDANPTNFGTATGFFVTGGTPITVGPPAVPGAYGTLKIVDNVASFVQNNIGVILSPPLDQPLGTPASYIDEVIDGTGQAGPLSINLTTNNNNPHTITVNGSNGGNVIQAGTGTEFLNGGTGNDTFNFDEAGAPFVFIGAVNGGGGIDTLNVGDAGPTNIDFTNVNPDSIPTPAKTIIGIDNFNIGTGGPSTGKFWEYQLADNGSDVSVAGSSQIIINVDGTNPMPHELRLAGVGIGPFANSSSFTLNLAAGAGSLVPGLTVEGGPVTAAVVVNDDGFAGGDIINLGYSTAAGGPPPLVTEVAYDGVGPDKITTGGNLGETDIVVLGAGGVDQLYATTNSSVIWQFANRSLPTGTSYVALPETHHAPAVPFVQPVPAQAAFLVASDLFDNSTYGGATGPGGAKIEISTNTDLSGATFVGRPNVIEVDNGQNLILNDLQLAQLNVIPGNTTIRSTNLGNTSTGLIVDVTQASFALSATDPTLGVPGSWTGSVTLVGKGAGGQTFDVSGDPLENFGGTGALYIYGGAGNDVAVFSGAEGQHGGVLDLLGGSNTLSVKGTTDFSAGGGLDIEHVNTISLGSTPLPGSTTATFSYQQIVNDMQSTGGSLTLTSAGGLFNYNVNINGTGNMDLSHVVDTGYLSQITNVTNALVNIIDNNMTSVTVYGTDNAEAFQATGAKASGDFITVNGHGDTVRAGKGQDLIKFNAYNVANNYQFRKSDLGTATATNMADLTAEGDVIVNLKANLGYADITGFAGVSSGVATSATAAGFNLGGVGGFGTFGVQFDNNASTPSFITGTRGTSTEKIQQSTINTAVTDILGHYTDSAINQGFIGIWDKNSDLALFYVNHNLAGALTQSQIQLVGVFDTNNGAATPGTLTLPSTFFHIHNV